MIQQKKVEDDDEDNKIFDGKQGTIDEIREGELTTTRRSVRKAPLKRASKILVMTKPVDLDLLKETLEVSKEENDDWEERALGW